MRNLGRVLRDKREYLIESQGSIKKFLKQFSGSEDKPARMDLFGKAEIEAIQFIDLTKNELESKKKFTAMIKRVEQMEIKTNQFFNFANEFQQKIYRYKNYEKFIDDLETDINLKELYLS